MQLKWSKRPFLKRFGKLRKSDAHVEFFQPITQSQRSCRLTICCENAFSTLQYLVGSHRHPSLQHNFRCYIHLSSCHNQKHLHSDIDRNTDLQNIQLDKYQVLRIKETRKYFKKSQIGLYRRRKLIDIPSIKSHYELICMATQDLITGKAIIHCEKEKELPCL